MSKSGLFCLYETYIDSRAGMVAYYVGIEVVHI